MPAAKKPSGSPGSTDGFDPSALEKAVIAIPLLRMIEEEQGLLAKHLGSRGKRGSEFNAVILLDPKTRAAAAKTPQQLRDLIDAALRREPGTDSAENRLGPRHPKVNGFFARLDARSIHRILSHHKGEITRWEGLRHTTQGKRIQPKVRIERILAGRFRIIIDLNLEYPGGRDAAREWVERAILQIRGNPTAPETLLTPFAKSRDTLQYVFASLTAAEIFELVKLDGERLDLRHVQEIPPDSAQGIKAAQLLKNTAQVTPEEPESIRIQERKLRAIYKIWPDFEIKTHITRSISTVKANAAINSFGAMGKGIVWGILDTGIQGDHPHFAKHHNIVDAALGMHRDFTDEADSPLVDGNGHGTHVAGIVAGEWLAKDHDGVKTAYAARYQNESGDPDQEIRELDAICGMAPECGLVSLKVLDDNGIGHASNLIAAIAHVQQINGYGRRILIHGVNISIGYDFDPEWFACGQSPLCVEVNRLVKAGVSVVVAAGNSGYLAAANGNKSAGLTVTINDPGNADLAITVGATHRDMPHVYGVSYFSSKGPTGDGRLKPDLVAPGEKIVSCASSVRALDGSGPREPSGLKLKVAGEKACEYVETSGTSMAAPHVSGVIASFLSVRREFIGNPEKVKRIFLSTCTDLQRDRYFQGAGLIDLMRAIQSV